MYSDKNFNELVRQYSRITQFPKIYEDIFKIDKPMRWLLADQDEQYVSFYQQNREEKLLEVDITGCFPTICKFLFSETNPGFIRKIEDLSDKKARNILIANTLKTTPYLKVLNIISKMVILGFIFDRQDSDKTTLLEFEKDGCLIVTSDQNIENCVVVSPFQEFIINAGFKFHIKKYDYYIRCNNTSLFWDDSNKELRLKGIYKHVPKEIKDFYIKLFSGTSTNIDLDIENFNKIYNHDSLQFIRMNGLSGILDKYYICDNSDDQNKVLNSTGKYEKYHWQKSQIEPRLYLYNFIYPVWLFYRRNLGGVI